MVIPIFLSYLEIGNISRYGYFTPFIDELHPNIAVSDTVIIPLNFPMVVFKVLSPYEVLDYSWRCCYMEQAEHLYKRSSNKQRVELKKHFESGEWEKYLVPFVSETAKPQKP